MSLAGENGVREIAVISGKGGTGKTTVVAAFASLAARSTLAVLADCDVDAPDLHLLLHPEVEESHQFRASRTAYIDPVRCTGCGLCEAHCRFDVIADGVVDPLSCEGCGVCYWVCPVQAVSLQERLSGHWYVSGTRYGPLVHARLEPGEENSGRLVSLVRKRAKELAEERGARIIITDGPPGIGCPVISTVTGADLALVVTEPTLSGMHDLGRVLGVCRHFGVPALVCVNRHDLYAEGTQAIEKECEREGIPVVGHIPYDPAATEATVRGVPVVEYDDTAASWALMALWEEVLARM